MAFTTKKPENGLIPEGTYEVFFKSGGYPDATKSGTEYFNIPLVIRNDVEQKCKNMYIWDAIWVHSSQKHIDYKVDHISDAVGIPYGTAFESLEDWGKYLRGKAMKVTVKHGEYNGKTTVNIQSYAKTDYPEVKHKIKTADVSVEVNPDDYEELAEDDDGDFPF